MNSKTGKRVPAQDSGTGYSEIIAILERFFSHRRWRAKSVRYGTTEPRRRH